MNMYNQNPRLITLMIINEEMPQITRPKRNSQVLRQQELLRVKLEEFCQHLEQEKSKKSPIDPIEPQNYIKETIRNSGTNGEPIYKSWVQDIVGHLEGGNVCNRIHESTFILIIEIILQAEDCRDRERGMYLLAASLFDNSVSFLGNHQAFLISRKEVIGKESLLPLVKYFVNTDKNIALRRWVGILCIQLHKNCPENHDRVDKGPDEYRHSLGQFIIEDTNKLLKIICGYFVKDLLQAGTQLHRLLPSSYSKTLYSGFAKDTTDIYNWNQILISFLDNLSNSTGISYKCTTGLCFIRSVALNPDVISTNKNHNFCMILDGNSIFVLASLKEVTFDQILEIPFHAISILRLVLCKARNEANSLVIKITFHQGSKGNSSLNGKEIDLNNCALQINLVDSDFLLDQIGVYFPNLKLEDETLSCKESEWNQRNFSHLSNHSSTCEIMVTNFKPGQNSKIISPTIENAGSSCAQNNNTNSRLGFYDKPCNFINAHEGTSTNNREQISGKVQYITGHYTRRLIHGLKVPYQQKITKPKAKQPLLVSRRSLASQAAMETSCQTSNQVKDIGKQTCLSGDNLGTNQLNPPTLVVKLPIPSLTRNLQSANHDGGFKPVDSYVFEKGSEETKQSKKISDRPLLSTKSNHLVRSVALETKKLNQRVLPTDFITSDLQKSSLNFPEENQTLQDKISEKKDTQNKVISSLFTTTKSGEFGIQPKSQSHTKKYFQAVDERDEASNLTAEAYNLLQEDAKILSLVTEKTYDNTSYVDYFDSSPILSPKNIIEHDNISKITWASKEIESDLMNSKFKESLVDDLSVELDCMNQNVSDKQQDIQSAEINMDQATREKIASQQLSDKVKNAMKASALTQVACIIKGSPIKEKFSEKELPANLVRIPDSYEDKNMQHGFEQANIRSKSPLNMRNSQQGIPHLAPNNTVTPTHLKISQNPMATNVLKINFTGSKTEEILTTKRKFKGENFAGPKKIRTYKDSRKLTRPNSALEGYLLEPSGIQTPVIKRLKITSPENLNQELTKYPINLIEQNIKEKDKSKIQLNLKKPSRRIEMQKALEVSKDKLSPNAKLKVDVNIRKPHVISFGPNGARNQGQVFQTEIEDQNFEIDPESMNYTLSSSRIRSHHRQKSFEKVFSKQKNFENNSKSDSSLCTTPPKISSMEQILTAENYSSKHIDESMLRASTPATRPRVGFAQYVQRPKVTKNGSPISRKHRQPAQIENISIGLPSSDFEKQSEEKQTIDEKSITLPAFGPKFVISKMPKVGPPLPEVGITNLVRHETTDNIHYTDMNSREVISREMVHDPFRSRGSQQERKNQFVELLRDSVHKTPTKVQEFDEQKEINKIQRVQRPSKSCDPLFTKSTEHKKETRPLRVAPINSLQNPMKEREPSIESWNSALHPHYQGIHDVVHRIANDLIIRLAKEEDSMSLIINQYIENGAKIVNQLRKSHEEERALILQRFNATKTEFINAQNKAQIEISGIYEGIRGNLISITAREWNKMQDEIRKLINDSRRS